MICTSNTLKHYDKESVNLLMIKLKSVNHFFNLISNNN